MTEPRAIVFDLDETLYRIRRFTVSGYAATSAHISAQSGRSRREIFCRLQGLYRRGRAARAYQELCEELGYPVAVADEWLSRHRAHRRRLRLTRTSAAVLRLLRERGWRIGVLTNGLPSIQRAKIEALDLASRIDAVVFADEHAEGGKPAPVAFDQVLTTLGVAPHRAVMVGDNPVCDVYGGRQAGLRTIRIVHPSSPTNDWEEADVVVTDLAEVPAAAERLLGAGA